MNALLKLTKNELIEVIDLLSLYDLAEEIKKIVDTNLLKKIKDALPQNKLKILHQISNRPHPFKPQRIGLEKWDGKTETLNKILHKKGLIRLSFALYQEDKSLIWYICHLLDIGRGATLSKLCKNEKNEKISNQISQDVLELINIQQKDKL